MNVRLFTVLSLALLAVLFIIQNVSIVEIDFLFWSLQLSRALLMFILLAVGIVIGWSLHALLLRRRDKPAPKP